MRILGAVVLLIGATLIVMGADKVAVIGGSLLLLFLVLVLRRPPKKTHDFTYSDQLKGMLQSYGGNPPPEVEPPDELREKRKRH